jgi:hypothetical protein
MWNIEIVIDVIDGNGLTIISDNGKPPPSGRILEIILRGFCYDELFT